MARRPRTTFCLYAAGHPSFVVDAYTRRILNRIGVHLERDSYETWRTFFMERLPTDVTLFNEYHALLDRLGSRVCLKSAPRCSQCPLQQICATGRKATAEA